VRGVNEGIGATATAATSKRSAGDEGGGRAPSPTEPDPSFGSVFNGWLAASSSFVGASTRTANDAGGDLDRSSASRGEEESAFDSAPSTARRDAPWERGSAGSSPPGSPARGARSAPISREGSARSSPDGKMFASSLRSTYFDVSNPKPAPTAAKAAGDDDDDDGTRAFETKSTELWSLAAARAPMSSRAAAARAAIESFPTRSSRGGCAESDDSAMSLAAINLEGVLHAMEVWGRVVPKKTAARSPGSSLTLTHLAEESETSAGSSETPFDGDEPGSGEETERQRGDDADAERAALSPEEEADRSPTTKDPGFTRALHAAAHAAVSSGDAVAITRVLSLSKRAGCRLPGGAALWGDVRVWRGIELPTVRHGSDDDDGGDDGDGDGHREWLVPGSTRVRRRRTLALMMASIGLPAHAIASVLSQLPRVDADENAAVSADGGGYFQNAQLASVDAVRPKPRAGWDAKPAWNSYGTKAGSGAKTPRANADADDAGARGAAGAGGVAGAAPRGKEKENISPSHASAPGIAVSHDAWVENMRHVVETASSTILYASKAAGSIAPWWALDECTTGRGGVRPFRRFESSTADAAADDDTDASADSDDDAAAPQRRRMRASTAHDARANLPRDRASVRLFDTAVTVVTSRLAPESREGGGGGRVRRAREVVAAGSQDGAFASWHPHSNVVVRASNLGWGAGGGGAATALTALCFLADAEIPGVGFESFRSASSRVCVGGTRGGGVAAWDVTTGACVLASPGSHAGAVSNVRAMINGSNSTVLALTSSTKDASVRLW